MVTVKDRFGDEVQLVMLRNPWGDFEWRGEWSDDSDSWTPESKSVAGWTDVNDGTFFMCQADFRKYFSRVQICRINDDYRYKSKKITHKHGSFCFVRFVVTGEGGHFYISVSQTDERCFDRKV